MVAPMCNLQKSNDCLYKQPFIVYVDYTFWMRNIIQYVIDRPKFTAAEN